MDIFSLDEAYLSDRQSCFVIQLTGKRERLNLKPRDKLIINRSLPYQKDKLALLVIKNKFTVDLVTDSFLQNHNPDSGDFIWGMVQTVIRELE